MLDHDEKFEEEFSNWAKAVLNLQKVRDGSISYIKLKMQPFIDELVQMHGPDEEDHFKELLIKVAVNGEVKKKKPNKNTNGYSWALYDKKCATCVDVFKKILDNFKDSCLCKRWERHACKDTISRSNYWWIVSKLYVSHNCETETSLGPEEVEPLAVLSLMSRCKLFHGNLLWFDVGQVLLSRHELMHSINNRLSDDKRDNYLLEMKKLIKKVAIDTSTTEVLKSFEEVENLTVALFTEDGEIHQLANKALQLQETCLNADFKSPDRVHATIKSLAMSQIESKSQELKLKLKYKDQLEKKEFELQKRELERKNEELKSQIQQHKIDELKRKLQYETEKNETREDNLTEIRSNMENKFEDLDQEKSKQAEEISSLKSEMEIKFKNLQQVKSKQDDEISSLKNTMENKFEDLQQEMRKQDGEMSSLNSKMEVKFKDSIQEKSQHDGEISSLKETMENKFEDLQQEISKQQYELTSLESEMKTDSQLQKSKQNDEISSLRKSVDKLKRKLQYKTDRNKLGGDNLTEIRSNMENNFEDLQQERSKQAEEISSLESEPENKLKGLKQERSKQDHGISMLKRIKQKFSRDHKLYKSQQDDEKSSHKTAPENKLKERSKQGMDKEMYKCIRRNITMGPKYKTRDDTIFDHTRKMAEIHEMGRQLSLLCRQKDLEKR